MLGIFDILFCLMQVNFTWKIPKGSNLDQIELFFYLPTVSVEEQFDKQINVHQF